MENKNSIVTEDGIVQGEQIMLCNEALYLNNLEQEYYLYSDDPYLIQKEDGLIVSLDKSFRNLYILDKDANTVKRYELNWCHDALKAPQVEETHTAALIPENRFTHYVLITFTIIAVLLLARRIKDAIKKK